MKKLIFSILFALVAFCSYAQHQFTRWVPTSGTDTYTAAITVPTFTSYTNSKPSVKFGNTNTGPATININSLGAIAIRKWDGDSWEPLTAGDIDVNTIYELAYTGTYFQLPIPGAGGSPGSSTSHNRLPAVYKVNDYELQPGDTSIMLLFKEDMDELTFGDFSAAPDGLQFVWHNDKSTSIDIDPGSYIYQGGLSIPDSTFGYIYYNADTFRIAVAGTTSGGGGAIESVAGDGIDLSDPANPTWIFPVGTQVAYSPAGNISAIEVESAINELDTEKASTGSVSLKANIASPTFTGTVTIPTPFTLGATSVTSTGTQLNYLNAATGTTGTASTNLVYSASPTLSGTPLTSTAASEDSTTQIANTAWVQRNALSLGSSLTVPTKQAYRLYPQYSVGTGQTALEIINLGNELSNTEDRNFITNSIVRSVGSLILGGNIKYNAASDRWEYYMSTATSYGSDWWEIGREGLNGMAVPQGTHPYQHPVGMNISIRNDFRSTSSSYTYVNQFMAPAVAIYESSASGLAQWTDTGGTQPMFLALAEEAKGSGGATGNFFQAESHGAGYGALRFATSNGTHASPTNSSSNKLVGAVYSTPYGGAYRRTAEIAFYTRGTVNGSQVGQSVVVSTSPDTDANLNSVFEFSYLRKVKTVNAPFEITNTSISTVPLYSSFAGFSPTNEASTVGVFQHLSTSTGGTAIYGLSTTSTASTAIGLGLIGGLGATSPTAPAVLISGRKNNGSNTFTDLASTETILMIRNNATDLISVLGNGTFTVGSIAGSAFRANASGTIQLYNSGSNASFGVISSANALYSSTIFQATQFRGTATPSSSDASAWRLDNVGNNWRGLVRPGSAGAAYQWATHTDTFDGTTMANTTDLVQLTTTVNPSSGSANFDMLDLGGTINQTGTYSGSNAMIRIHPTLTAVIAPMFSIVSESVMRGGVGAGASPTAQWHIGPVSTSLASLRIEAGSTTTAPSSPNSGDIWHQGTNNRLMFYKGSSSQEFMTAVQVNSVSPTAPNRTIQLTIDGTTYYIHAKTTND